MILVFLAPKVTRNAPPIDIGVKLSVTACFYKKWHVSEHPFLWLHMWLKKQFIWFIFITIDANLNIFGFIIEAWYMWKIGSNIDFCLHYYYYYYYYFVVLKWKKV